MAEFGDQETTNVGDPDVIRFRWRKLRSVCARQPWDKRFADDPQTQHDEASQLTVRFESDPSRLLRHLDWLAGHEARSAERLGFALGRIDEGFVLGEMIFKQAIATSRSGILC